MNEIVLSSQEIMCLCAAAGIDKVFGITDGFADVPKQELAAKVQETTDGLAEKGFVEMDFNGNSKLSAEAVRLISSIGNCENTLTVQMCIGEEIAKAYVFYKSKNSVLCSEILQGKYRLSIVSSEETLSLLSDFFNVKECEAECKYSAEVDVKTFGKASKADYVTAKSILSDMGLDNTVSDVLAKSFASKADSFSAVAVPLVPGELSTEGIAVVSDGETMLELKPNMPDFYNDEETVIISETTASKAQEKLMNMLIKFGFAQAKDGH